MIAICSDHAGFELKAIVEGYLEANNLEYKDFGTFSSESCDYADFTHPCAEAVESGECYPGIAMCGSGNGIAMTTSGKKVMPIFSSMKLTGTAIRRNSARALVSGLSVKVSIQKPTACNSSAVHC